MRIHNLLPAFEDFVRAAESAQDRPAERREAFERCYVEPNRTLLGPLLEDVASWSEPLEKRLGRFDAKAARETLERLARDGHPQRAHRTVEAVERFLGAPLEGDLVLFGALGRMDGYARFDRGSHVVYIGLDYPAEGSGGVDAATYFDILIAHELGHVVREGRPGTWSALGERIDMSHDDFVERVPFDEHMLGEGLSTALSEVLYPGHGSEAYLFFEPAQARWCEAHDAEIAAVARRLYGTRQEHWFLYGRDAVAPGSPERTQYYWGWQVVKRLMRAGRDLRDLFATPAPEILDLAGERRKSD